MRIGWLARAARLRPAIPVGVLLLTSLLGPPATAANLPPGFEEVVVASGGQLSSLRAIAIAPDGDVFITAGFGWVWVLRNGVVTKIAQIPVHYAGEDGLCGITLDPDYPTNHHVWITYSVPSATGMRVSRFTFTGSALVSEAIMVEWTEASTWHNAGCLRFASDKTLFISTGDDYLRSATAQNPHDLRGKILHINRDGSPAAGNPYLDGVLGDPRVWAIGFRNPFRFNLQPHTDNLFIADVGDGTWEELSIGVAGGNFGWAAVEGPTPAGQPGYVYPIYWYDHSDPIGAAITGGDHADEGDFSPEYHGDYFFGDSSRSKLYRMRLDEYNQPLSTEVFGTDTPMPVDIQFGPDGALYYASYVPATVRKIVYVGGTNGQPIAAATVIPDAGPAPLATLLDGSGSSDPDDDALSYLWDLGDGNQSTQAVVNHGYGPGIYQARLTVDDGNGGSDQTTDLRIVSGNRRPNAAIAAPVDGNRYTAGQLVTYSGSGTDPEDGSLSCARFSWTVTFHHLGHVHPFVGPLQGNCSGSFTTDNRGETSVETYYEVKLSVQDSGAPLGAQGSLSGSRSVEIHPYTTTMNLATAPRPDLQLVVDTQVFTAPYALEGVVDFIRTVGVVEPQIGQDGHTYRWLSWSDGGAREHEIQMGAFFQPASGFGVTPTLTANFTCDVIQEVPGLRLEKSWALPFGAPTGTLTLRWDPVADPCLSGGPARYQIYAAASARPLIPPGRFPDDPHFTLIGESEETTFTYTPGPDESYFLVVAVGTDGLPGRSGSYGD